MKFQILTSLSLVVVMTVLSPALHAYEEASKVQRSIGEILKRSPEVRSAVDEAMRFFRKEELCGTEKESKRPKGSKSCTDLMTFDAAAARSAADLKECQAKCSAGAASVATAKAPKSKDAGELAKCIASTCNDECAQIESLFMVKLEQTVKGAMMDSLETESSISNRGATKILIEPQTTR